MYLTDTRKPCAYKRNIEARSINHCWSGKAVSITYSECMLKDLIIKHAMRMRCIRPLWLSATGLALPSFFHISTNDMVFVKKKKVLTIKRVFLFPVQLLSETSLILRIIRLHTIRNLHRSSREVPVVLFPTDFRKIPKYQIS